MSDTCPCSAPLVSAAEQAHGVCDSCRVESHKTGPQAQAQARFRGRGVAGMGCQDQDVEDAVTTRRERAEAKAFRDAMKRKYPPCRWCKQPVTCGQRDGTGTPSHYMCQMAFMLRRRPHKRAVPPHPRLPYFPRGEFPHATQTPGDGQPPRDAHGHHAVSGHQLRPATGRSRTEGISK